MYNKNFVIGMYGDKVQYTKETDKRVEPKVKDNWSYHHKDNKVYKEEISYGFEAYEDKSYYHKVYASFYSEFPLEGFDFSHSMVYGGVNLETFCKNVASTYIPGSWCY